MPNRHGSSKPVLRFMLLFLQTLYFGDHRKLWMINFRVAYLDAMVRQLRDAGISVAIDPEPYPNGRFARLHNSEGNPIEHWEPVRRDSGRPDHAKK